MEQKDGWKSCAASASKEFSFKTGKVGSNATFRGTALLSGETQRGQEHAVEAENNRRHVCYGSASPVRMARLVNCRIRVPYDETHIHHTMPEVMTLQYTSFDF